MSTGGPAKKSSSPPRSSCCRPMRSTTRCCCCTPASANLMIRQPARASSARNYCHQTTSNVMMFVDDEINPWIGTGTSPAAIDDFQGDNFDHAGLGFFGGGFIAPAVSCRRPIQARALPPGHPPGGSPLNDSTPPPSTPPLPLTLHAINLP